MPPRTDLILFVDLETTGNDDDKDEIIEIGLAMIDTEDFEEVAHFSRVIKPSNEAFIRLIENPIVYEMHKANGLLDDIIALKQNPTMRDYSPDWEIKDWLDEIVDRSTTHIPLAGSGVSHFDRKYIDKFLPMFSKRITYWSYDVGVLRRMFDLAGVPRASMEAKSHRGLNDARVHADEFRFYMSFIKEHGEEH